MGAAKRRGTFEQRKAQKLASQYGMTNAEIARAYNMNRAYNLHKLRSSKDYQRSYATMQMLMYNHLPSWR